MIVLGLFMLISGLLSNGFLDITQPTVIAAMQARSI